MRLLTKGLAVLGVVGCILTSSALNLDIGDARYLGYFQPGHPASAEPVTAWLNYLIDRTSSGSSGPVVVDGYAAQTFYRSSNFLPPTVLPDAVWAYKDDVTEENPHSAAYLYITAKYDSGGGGTAVWYLGDLVGVDTVKVPRNAFGNGLSAINLFNSTAPPVPDGGTTAMLFGIALSSVALLRRKLG